MTANTLKQFEDITIQLKGVQDKRLVETICWAELKYLLRNEIAPAFWKHFECNCNEDGENQSKENRFTQYDSFLKAVNELYTNFNRLNKIIQNIGLFETKEAAASKKLKEMVREILLAQLPAHFSDVVAGFYSVAYEVFCTMNSEKDAEEIEGKQFVNCPGCNVDHGHCRCSVLEKKSNELNRILIDLGLLDRIAGQSITSLIQNKIKSHIIENCKGVLDRSHLKELITWVQQKITQWLITVFNYGNEKTNEVEDTKVNHVIEGFTVKLTYYLYENFAQSIIDQFFNIIIDYPESIPAIEDLKICLEKIDMRKHLMETIKSTLQYRILHPGVNTTDILTGYVAAIKTIRHLDPSGLILESVTEPIKEYLRKRSDTVRQVVSSLTEEGPTDLSEELAKGEVIKDSTYTNNEITNWENWLPDPFTIEKKTQRPQPTLKRTADIISMIVDIYGSKELFMNEYRNLMADRLLSNLDLNPEKEIRNLELLKLRFGENLLHNCEVMIKDVSDSKRINTHISSDSKYLEDKEFDINLLIISAQFWPAFNKEQLELPLELQSEFKKYITSYESYKGNRTLNLRTVTGKVSIEVEFGNKTTIMTVSPTQAVILYYFQSKNEWSIEELSNLMKVPQCTIRRRIVFWINYGILVEVRSDVYRLVEGNLRPSNLEDTLSCTVDMEDEAESAMASANDQREEELQVFWSYIVGMLTNLDSLPLERIHQMLKLFASNGVGKEFTQDELRQFLQRKVKEHKLIYSCGVYQLTK